MSVGITHDDHLTVSVVVLNLVKTSGQSNLTTGRIVPEHGSFNRIL